MRDGSRGSGRFSPSVLAALGSGVLLVLVSFTIAACGAVQANGPSESSSSLTVSVQNTTTSSPDTTTAALPVSIPAALARFAPLVDRLRAEGVPMLGVQAIQPGFWGAADSGVTVLIQSASKGDLAAEGDAVNTWLVARAAALEKTAGMDIQAIGYEFVNAAGQLMGENDERVDTTIDPSWYGTAGTTAQLVEQTVQSQFKSEFGSGLFDLVQTKVVAYPDGSRVLVTELRVPSVTEANPTIDKVVELFQATVAKLNRDQQAKLGVSRITVRTPDGQTVLDWVDDLELGQATGYWADGITNYWFPTPAPAPSS